MLAIHQQRLAISVTNLVHCQQVCRKSATSAPNQLSQQRCFSTSQSMSSTRHRGRPDVSAKGTTSADTVVPSTSTGHAWLHDFCVAIPYGAAMAALTLVAWLQQHTSFATILLGASIGSLSFTYLSLQNWKADKNCKPYTLLTAGAAAAAAFFGYQRGAVVSSLLTWPVAGGSALVSLFLLYNVLAGGNPPQGEKPLAEAAPHSVD